METRIEDCKMQNARCKNSKEKEVIRMKRLIGLGLAILLVCGLSVVSFAGEATDTVTITVAPVVDYAFTIEPPTINLGEVGLGVSTGNVTGLTITNTGTITLTFTKTVSEIVGSPTYAWEMAESATKDKFLLKAAAQENAPSDWDAQADLKFNVGVGTYNPLTDDATPTAEQLSLDKDDTESLYFMLDMPTALTYPDSQTITVTIKGTSS